MNDAGGISAILGRIGGIESRFTPPSSTTPPSGPPPPEGFEPFGEVYERAVAARWAPAPGPTAIATASRRSSSSYRSYDEQVDLVRRKGL